MVIKQIAKQVRKTGFAEIYYDEGRDVQWISNGYGVWALYGMPLLDAENVLTALDIPEKEKQKIVVRERTLPAGFDFSDTTDEEELKDPVLSICYGGSLVIPLQTKDGTILADPELFKPLRDVDQLTVHARRKQNGEIYLAAKGGLLLQGIVLPKELRGFAALPDVLSRLAETLEESVTEEAKRRGDEDEEQMEIDPETGEVVES